MNVVVEDGGWGDRSSGNVYLPESNAYLSFRNTDGASDESSPFNPLRMYSGASTSPVKAEKEHALLDPSNDFQPASINQDHARLYRRHKEIDALPKVDTGVDCSVCLCSNANSTIINCGHHFHSACAMRWLRQHGTCPVCRVVVKDLKPVGASGPTPSVGNSNEVDLEEDIEEDVAAAVEAEVGDVSSFLDDVFDDNSGSDRNLVGIGTEESLGLPIITQTPGQVSSAQQPDADVPSMYPGLITTEPQLSAPYSPQYAQYAPASGPLQWIDSAHPYGRSPFPEHSSSLCSVCFKQDVDVIVNPCKHVYHGSCVKPLLEASVGDCPLCHSPIMGFSPIESSHAHGGRVVSAPMNLSSFAPPHYPAMPGHSHTTHDHSPLMSPLNPNPNLGGGGVLSTTTDALSSMTLVGQKRKQAQAQSRALVQAARGVSGNGKTQRMVVNTPINSSCTSSPLMLPLRSAPTPSGELVPAQLGGSSSPDQTASPSLSSASTSSPSPSHAEAGGEQQQQGMEVESGAGEGPCCTCTNGCRNTRCACVRATGVCGPKCGCNDCRNPFKSMAEAGISLASVRAFADDCLFQNLSKVKNMKKKLSTIVTLSCCKVKMPLAQCVTGADCPKCGERHEYSWCWGKMCSVKTLPRNHCKTCKHCGDHRNVHCMHCGMCYFAGVGSGQSCVCKEKLGRMGGGGRGRGGIYGGGVELPGAFHDCAGPTPPSPYDAVSNGNEWRVWRGGGRAGGFDVRAECD